MNPKPPAELSAEEWALVEGAIARLRAGVLAITGAVVGGAGLALATLWLVILGGEPVGPHLGLLANYFPGYTVTGPGVAVGFCYGALSGALLGGTIGWIYNKVVSLRMRSSGAP
jgi:hypothetical protein